MDKASKALSKKVMVWGEIVIIAAIYIMTAFAGQTLAIPSGNVTTVWLPSGIMLAMVLIRGHLIWPGIFLGAMIGNTWAYRDISSLMGLGATLFAGIFNGIGNVLGLLGSALLIRHFTKTDNPFRTSNHIISFLILGVLAGPAVSASFSVTSLSISGFLPWQSYTYVWVTWLTFNAVGVLIITPVILSWVKPKQVRKKTTLKELFIFTLVLLSSILCFFILPPSSKFNSMVMLAITSILLWSVFRFKQTVTFSALLVVSAIVIFAASIGHGTFSEGSMNNAFIALMGVTILLTSAVVTERQEIRDKLDNFKMTIDGMVDSVFMFDHKKLTFFYVNQEAVQQFGYSLQEYLKLSFLDLTPNFTIEAFNQLAAPLLDRTRASLTYETSYKHKNGHLIPVEVSLQYLALFYETERFVAIVKNIEKRKKANKTFQKSEERFQKYFELGLIGMAITSPDKSWVHVNDCLCEIFGYSREELVTKKWSDLTYPDDLTKDNAQFNRVIKGEIDGYAMDKRFIRKTGDVMYGRISVKCLRTTEGDIDSFVVLIQDITEHKKNEEALKEQVNELAKTRKELLDMKIKAEDAQNQADAAKEEAERANRAKSNFLANMSHEIRTPMNAIIGLTQLALKSDMTPQQKDYLESISIASESLIKLINEIFDFSKIEAGMVSLETVGFDLSCIFDKITNQLRLKAEEKKLDFMLSIKKNVPRYLIGDPLRLEQILVNLTANAIKFTLEGGVVVKVSLMTTTQSQATLLFSVEDTGVGIPAEAQKSLFDAFTQADDSTTRQFYGTGLGLAICKSLAKIMGGEIFVKSNNKKGTIFSFTVSFGIQNCQYENKLKALTKEHNKHLVVIDETETCRLILSDMLSDFSFHVTLCSSCKEALQKLSKEPFCDILIISQNIHDLDKCSQVKSMKNVSEISPVPIIMMSSTCTHLGTKIEKNISDHTIALTKPFTHWALYDALEDIFGLKHTQSCPESELIDVTIGSAKELSRYTILLVEDNVINQKLACEVFEKAGFVVELAYNGKEAVDKVAHKNDHYYDAIVMDIQMPEMDGYEATRLIRQNSHNYELPIIAMTAHAKEKDRENCLNAGMNDYIIKPFDVEQLLSTVVKCIKSKKVQSKMSAKVQKTEELYDIPEGVTNLLSGIDVDSCMRRLSGDFDFFMSLLEEFNDHYRSSADKIIDALNRKDFKTACEMAHTIKGVAGNLSAYELSEASSKLEEALKNERYYDSAPLVEEFKNALTQVITSAMLIKQESLLSDKETTIPHIPQHEQAHTSEPLMKELADYLKRNNTHAQDVLSHLEQNLSHAGVGKELELLKESLEKFDFKTALSYLQKIADSFNVSLQ